MKRFSLFLFLVVGVFGYADLQVITNSGAFFGLYDDTAFGFTYGLQPNHTFLKANRPPTSLVLMLIDGKIIPVGSSVGFFNQRPVVTNGQLYVLWEARELQWKIFIKPLFKPELGDGFLVTFEVTNIEKKSKSLGIQVLFDVVLPLADPVGVANHVTKITQESLFQGKSMITQCAFYSQQTNLPGFTLVAQEPIWQKLAIAEWKQLYDYLGDAPIRKKALFTPISAAGVALFYPVQKIEAYGKMALSYWIGVSLPPEGIVKQALPVVTKKEVVEQTNQPRVEETPPQEVTKQKEEPPAPLNLPTQWELCLDRFELNRDLLTPEHEQKLREWFESLPERNTLVFSITGHTDSKGSTRYNLVLARKRAEAVARWLQSQGVPSKNLVILSRGESEPVSANDDALNRRVEIVAKRKTP
ncbi:OmpA family protein [Thermospira aquatica]|uniref:OmpA family protein n=1 Tax=Thermospira aquatica TaxID=2828656 RepID=A0AAX3BFK8_9SPIR|nr:OmpA family protein [Thermospira aquatica]URA11075.1 OmpA family protein [Thermospira aquatica]